MVTDFHQIRPGALARANGGFLVLEALDVLRNPFAWEALKRALLSAQVRAENLGEQLSAFPTATLRPEPIALDLKVVLIGSSPLYHLLYALDEDFRELFKVKVDFTPEMAWSDEHVRNYAAVHRRQVREDDLRHFDRTAVARVVEYGARLARASAKALDPAARDRRRRHRSELLGRQGRPGARRAPRTSIWRSAKKEYRSNRIEERLRELDRRRHDPDRDGGRAGRPGERPRRHRSRRPRVRQAVARLGQVSIGRGSLQSIEREIELSGPIHSKGFLILSGYLAGQVRAGACPSPPRRRSPSSRPTRESRATRPPRRSCTRCSPRSPASRCARGIAVTGSVDQHGQRAGRRRRDDEDRGVLRGLQGEGADRRAGRRHPRRRTSST